LGLLTDLVTVEKPPAVDALSKGEKNPMRLTIKSLGTGERDIDVFESINSAYPVIL